MIVPQCHNFAATAWFSTLHGKKDNSHVAERRRIPIFARTMSAFDFCNTQSTREHGRVPFNRPCRVCMGTNVQNTLVPKKREQGWRGQSPPPLTFSSIRVTAASAEGLESLRARDHGRDPPRLSPHEGQQRWTNRDTFRRLEILARQGMAPRRAPGSGCRHSAHSREAVARGSGSPAPWLTPGAARF